MSTDHLFKNFNLTDDEITYIINTYMPLINKYSYVNSKLDEDCRQEIMITIFKQLSKNRKKVIRKVHNPMTDIPKPHINPYIADYYKSSELKRLFEIVRDDILEVPILLAGRYGLRRSEVIGLKWNVINFENDTFVVKHTITNVTDFGENQEIESRDLTKSKYGYRTYPLTPEIKKALIKQKVNIETNKKLIFRDKYIIQTEDYVCVKEDGSLIKANHFTRRFKLLIKQHHLHEIRLHDI